MKMTENEKWRLKHRISLTAKMVTQVTEWFCRNEATIEEVEKWEKLLSDDCDLAAQHEICLGSPHFPAFSRCDRTASKTYEIRTIV